MTHRALVDLDLCYGATTCALAQPTVFRINDLGQSVLIAKQASSEALLDAAKGCPAQAIRVIEKGHQIWPPQSFQPQ